ncbi:DNA-methyltransferase [Microvirga terrestris]|uniref:Methyltransferase n=1 Tax=Microvirga terrestris TaxID=2791024 RepID=A0ABS0HNP7_9HYPH|nr:site-specific DNA-methyltransferase [Microvirga terrestris]MBF9195093.1 site-specific DNA-methyltransferase [Microvirga terrestris]
MSGDLKKVTIGAATLYLGDCLDALTLLDNGVADAFVTDPPYCSGGVSEASRSAAKGQGLRSENISRFGWFVGDNMGTAGLVFLLRSIGFAATKIMKPTGSMLMFCDWRMLPNLAPAVESSGLRYQNMVVWDKQMMGLGTGFRAQHEVVMHFTNGSPEYHDKGTSNVIRSKRVSHTDREHQTQKPGDLMSDLIKVVAPKGGVVVDPFMGSGSTGVAAVRLGRKFIGIERDPAYFEIACRRMEEAQSQLDMFGAVATDAGTTEAAAGLFEAAA